MPSRRILIVLSLIMLLSISLACLVTGSEEPVQEGSSEDVIATSVAATIAAAENGEAAQDPPPPTTHPTVTAGPKEPNFTYAGVSFYFNPLLADDLTAGVEPGFYQENNPWWSTPEHRLYQFNNWVLSDTFHQPIIRVYPVADFRAINDNVSSGLDALQLALDTRPADHAGLHVSDLFNAGQLYQSNVKYLDFHNGRGARWLALYGQAYYPIGWPNLFYAYQGLTDDGQYYVSVILPVNHPNLPHPEEVELNDAFALNYETYRMETGAQMEAEGDNTFVPSLVLLDEIIASLTISQP